MTDIGAGKIIYDLRKKIQAIRSDLIQLDEAAEIPEMIDSANLRRSNEYLTQINAKKTELLSAYEQYSVALEELLTSILDIQKDLKEILKEQSQLIPNSRKKQSKHHDK